MRWKVYKGQRLKKGKHYLVSVKNFGFVDIWKFNATIHDIEIWKNKVIAYKKVPKIYKQKEFNNAIKK